MTETRRKQKDPQKGQEPPTGFEGEPLYHLPPHTT